MTESLETMSGVAQVSLARLEALEGLEARVIAAVVDAYGSLENARMSGLGHRLLSVLGFDLDPKAPLEVPTQSALDSMHADAAEHYMLAKRYSYDQQGKPQMTVYVEHLQGLLNERTRLTEQVKRLREDASKLVIQHRGESIEHCVREFHVRFGHPVEDTPHVIDDEQVRFRMRLVTEEYLEFMNACLDQSRMGDNSLEESARGPNDDYPWSEIIRDARYSLKILIDEAPIKVDLVEMADATVDLDYVIEGTRLVFGIRRGPLLREVQRANMEKAPVLDESGKPTPHTKPTKPAHWRSPNILGCLEAQGYKGAA